MTDGQVVDEGSNAPSSAPNDSKRDEERLREKLAERRLRERLKRRQESRRKSLGSSDGTTTTTSTLKDDAVDKTKNGRDQASSDRSMDSIHGSASGSDKSSNRQGQRNSRDGNRGRGGDRMRNRGPPPHRGGGGGGGGGRHPPQFHNGGRPYGHQNRGGPPVPPPHHRAGPMGGPGRYGHPPPAAGRGPYGDERRRGPSMRYDDRNRHDGRRRGSANSGSAGGGMDSLRNRTSRQPPPRGRDRTRSYSRSRSRSYSRSRSRSYSSDDSRSCSSRDSSIDSAESSGSATKDDPATKDQRTVFVSQLVMRANERVLRKYFRKRLGCKVKDVIMLRDKRTHRHKGCAYVELGRLSDIPKAIEANGVPPNFQRFPILIKGTETEKNYTVATTVSSTTRMNSGAGRSAVSTASKVGKGATLSVSPTIQVQRVYVGNLDPTVTQQQMQTIFSAFGRLDKVVMQTDPSTGLSRGFALLFYTDPKHAFLAIQTMGGCILGTRAIKAEWAKHPSGSGGWVNAVTSNEFPDDADNLVQAAKNALSQLSIPTLLAVSGIPQATTSTTTTTTTTLTSVSQTTVPTTDASIIGNADSPTNTLLVYDTFNKDAETEDGWEEDLRLDFEEECSKFGKLKSIRVVSDEPGGKIVAAFEDVSAAKSCASTLAGRWFDKRQLRVEFVPNETEG